MEIEEVKRLEKRIKELEEKAKKLERREKNHYTELSVVFATFILLLAGIVLSFASGVILSLVSMQVASSFKPFFAEGFYTYFVCDGRKIYRFAIRHSTLLGIFPCYKVVDRETGRKYFILRCDLHVGVREERI